MSKRVDGSIGTMLQGISQQPRRHRLAGQVEDAVNMTSDVVQMLHRRPPSLLTLAVLDADFDADTSFVHFVEGSTDASRFFYVINANGTAKRVTAAGVVTTMTLAAGVGAYLTTVNPRLTLRAGTIGGTTLVSNTETAPTMDTAPVKASQQTFMVEITQGLFNTDYTVAVTLDGITQTANHKTATSIYETSTGSDLTDARDAEEGVKVDKITEELRILMAAWTFAGFSFTVSRTANFLSFVVTSGVPSTWSITQEDNPGISVYDMTNISNIGQLPAMGVGERAASTHIVTVSGGKSDTDTAYYGLDVGDSAESLAPQNGTWVETIASGVDTSIAADTMPVHFLYAPAESHDAHAGFGGDTVSGHVIPAWAERLVGDDVTNPLPDFIGKPIVDIAAFQDRLVLLTADAVNMSVTSDLFNHWRKTTLVLLADGPINVSSNSDRSHLIRYASIQDKDLTIFADTVQFHIDGATAVTPENATLQESSSFEMQSSVRPVRSGQSIFFPIDRGRFSGIREYYTDSNINTKNARPVTVHVDELIRGSVELMASSTNLDKLVVKAEGNQMYLYEYLWDDAEKIQSSWTVWNLRDEFEVASVAFTPSTLLVLGSVGSDMHLLTLDITLIEEVTDDRTVYADHRQLVNFPVDTGTVSDLPIDLSRLVAVQGDNCPFPGMRIKITDYNGTTMTLAEDMQGGDVHVGVRFRSSVKPTMPIVRDAENNEIGTSDLVIGNMFINYAETAEFDVDVVARYSYTARFSGRIIGSPTATIGQRDLSDGQFPVAVRSKTNDAQIEVYTDGPFPLRILDMEWDGKYYKRGTRITRQGG